MLSSDFDEVTEEDLNSLVRDKVGESRTIEFKSQLPSSNDKDKKEFLADVSSLANAVGGDLIYGIEADNGVASEALKERRQFVKEQPKEV
ncbi:ATP-binding protein [Verrucomicrobia bacterium]|jgi:predicted HTH transcriptional regulator|nr:ATP-binding protein [Verrucomicrobiota bacterium]